MPSAPAASACLASSTESPPPNPTPAMTAVFPADLGDRGLDELAVLFSGQRVEFAGTAGSNNGAERVANHFGYVGAATVNVEGKVGFEVGDREGDHASQPAAQFGRRHRAHCRTGGFGPRLDLNRFRRRRGTHRKWSAVPATR